MNKTIEIYRTEQLPVFQNRMYPSEQEAKACAKGDVVLTQDMNTGLIFNTAFDPDLLEYDADYQNEQAVSSHFRAHLDDVTQIIDSYFKDHLLIEVGCGKGYFLEHLQQRGIEVTGLDPTYEGDNQAVIKEFFTPDLDLHADGIILRHVLEHVQDPVAFLNNIKASNLNTGKIYIEVPCFNWISEHNAWFDIFYEHVNYFRISDFNRMFGTVERSGHLFGGQYLYIVADLATLRTPVYDNTDPVAFPDNFLSSVERYATQLSRHTDKQAVIWGGASKGVIFALFMQRAGIGVNCVVDINPAKQDKYLPATGLRVQAPEDVIGLLDSTADIYVMNGNYLDEIKQQTHCKFNYIRVDHEVI